MTIKAINRHSIPTYDTQNKFKKNGQNGHHGMPSLQLSIPLKVSKLPCEIVNADKGLKK